MFRVVLDLNVQHSSHCLPVRDIFEDIIKEISVISFPQLNMHAIPWDM